MLGNKSGPIYFNFRPIYLNNHLDTLVLLRTLTQVREELGITVGLIAQEIGSRKARFILELIQNAEDNTFTRTDEVPAISFDVSPDRIIVECNEDGFTERNVISICRTGQSSKTSNRGYVGEKGIGFKSVFQVASKVHIQSNSFSFSFHYDGSTSGEAKLGIVTPIPENDVIPVHERPLTRMTLTPLTHIPYSDLEDQFKDIPEDLLLFLSTLRELRITIRGSDGRPTTTTFQKLPLQGGIVKLIKVIQGDPAGRSETRYRIIKRELTDLPAHVARSNIHECEVVLAFPVNSLSRPLICPQKVFAFLPIRDFGFNFLIQADFIMEAGRQDVVDSLRNKAILEGVADTFCNAVLEFCSIACPLRYTWMRYLPSTEGLDYFWKSLPLGIIRKMQHTPFLLAAVSNTPRLPSQLRILPMTHLDKDRIPLFEDLAGDELYISHSYRAQDIKILRNAFGIKNIEDGYMYLRIEEDLKRRDSKMRALPVDEDWHNQVAKLISGIYTRQPTLRDRISGLRLIPLSDGRWENAMTQWYFPAQTGPPVPADLISTIHPEADSNAHRKALFTTLGVEGCPLQLITRLIKSLYLTNDGATDTSASKAHLKFLYWHHEIVNNSTYFMIWLYDQDQRKVNSRLKTIYFPSEDEFGPQELLKAMPHRRDPTRIMPRCPVSFLDSEYLDAFPAATRRGQLSWIAWLEEKLGVRRFPSLKSNGGSLSSEFRHIIEYQPGKLIGTLKKYWDFYKDELNDAVTRTISEAKVPCSGGRNIALQKTYAPVTSLVDKVEALGISRGFPFLDLEGETQVRRNWRFLEEFDVTFAPDLQFYVEVLRRHQAHRRESWNVTTQRNILKTYEVIADQCSESEKIWLRETIDKEELVLDPCSFQPDSTRPVWIDIDSCLWEGPENLLVERPLANCPQYCTDKLSRFFKETLGIKNANWENYLEMLSRIKNNSSALPGTQGNVLRLYHLLDAVTSTRARAKIEIAFEEKGLIFVPSTELTWYPTSKCLWASPVPIDGKVVIGNSYLSEAQAFFLDFLGISPASLDTLVLELMTVSQRQNPIRKATQLIWAINAMDPKRGELDELIEFEVLPIRRIEDGERHTTLLQSPRGDFLINDRNVIAEVLQNEPGVSFLAFTLEEVTQLAPFLQALNLEGRYISFLSKEQTSCSDQGLIDSSLTARFRERAYDILRCAFTYRSSLAKRDTQALYDLLLNASLRQTNGISKKLTVRLRSGEVHALVPGGLVHVAVEEGILKVFVPQDRKGRELCYLRSLPVALAEMLQIPDSTREFAKAIIGNVLGCSLYAIDDLLEGEGIGNVPAIPPPSRVYSEQAESEVAPEETFETSTSATVPRLAARGTTAGFTEIELPGHPSVRRGGSEVSEPSTATVGYNGTPVSDDRDAFSQRWTSVPDSPIQSDRSPTPENIEREAFIENTAYVRLLDNVIRIAGHTNLPHKDSIVEAGIGQVYDRFDHAATFGVRSQAQMSHDFKIGAAGELFVYEMLSDILSSFGVENWKSTIRKEVTVHPKYRAMRPWQGAETADIVYTDSDSILTELLIALGYLDNVWTGAYPKYFIEVKTTTGECNGRFFMNNSQYNRMQRMSLTPGMTAAEIYVVFRVYNLTRDTVNVKIYVDPEASRQENILLFEPQSWTVTQRA